MSPHDEILKAALDLGWKATVDLGHYLALRRGDRAVVVQFTIATGRVDYAHLSESGPIVGGAVAIKHTLAAA